jgi:DNA/RNA-binding domain of Phe-tRNA-synthetase-like protein
MNIIVTDKISAVCPEFVGAAVEAHVQNTTFCPELWDEINALCEDYRSRFTTVSIKEMAAIEATRRVYRACGKDPSRYRPAAEALIRRVVQGKELYQIDTLVDLINLASMKYGYSIGGFDADKFVGDTLALGVGEPGEPYEGIGRGMLNIEGMPVYRDQKGGVGTPTSDNERTKIDITTTHVLVLINGYDGNTETVSANADFVKSLLERYAGASDVVINSYKMSNL